jgi:hypothetical protein
MKTTAISNVELRDMNSAEIEVHGVQCTADEARALIDNVEDEALVAAIDQAQGDVFSGSAKVGYVVLKITPNAA